MPLRDGLLSKLFAAWFVVLIVLPFTAPFQVYDQGAPMAKTTPGHELKTSDKVSHHVAIAASISSTIGRPIEDTAHVRHMRHRLRPFRVLPPVLRL